MTKLNEQSSFIIKVPAREKNNSDRLAVFAVAGQRWPTADDRTDPVILKIWQPASDPKVLPDNNFSLSPVSTQSFWGRRLTACLVLIGLTLSPLSPVFANGTGFDNLDNKTKTTEETQKQSESAVDQYNNSKLEKEVDQGQSSPVDTDQLPALNSLTEEVVSEEISTDGQSQATATADQVGSETVASSTVVDTELDLMEDLPASTTPEVDQGADVDPSATTTDEVTASSTDESLDPLTDEVKETEAVDQTASNEYRSPTVTESPASSGAVEDGLDLDQVRAEIEAELRLELEEKYLAQLESESSGNQVFDLEKFSAENCTWLSAGEFYCLSEEGFERDRADQYQHVAAYPDKRGVYQVVYQEGGNRVRVLTDNDFDDLSPVYNPDSRLIVWQRLIDDRWQVVVYDLDLDQEVVVTSTDFNNIKPVAGIDGVIWQGWSKDSWQIFYARRTDNWRPEQLTDGRYQNVEPQLYGDTALWRSYRSGLWHVITYSLNTARERSVGTGRSGANPRLLVVWDETDQSGEQMVRHFDPLTKRSGLFGVRSEKGEDEREPIPNPFETDQEPAVVNSGSRDIEPVESADDDDLNDDDLDHESQLEEADSGDVEKMALETEINDQSELSGGQFEAETASSTPVNDQD